MNTKLAVMLIIMSLLAGVSFGTYTTTADYQAKMIANERLIREQVQIAVNSKIRERNANMKLYEAIYHDIDKGQQRSFFYRAVEPFPRAIEILEEKEVEYSNLKIQESALLKEGKDA